MLSINNLYNQYTSRYYSHGCITYVTCPSRALFESIAFLDLCLDTSPFIVASARYFNVSLFLRSFSTCFVTGQDDRSGMPIHYACRNLAIPTRATCFPFQIQIQMIIISRNIALDKTPPAWQICQKPKFARYVLLVFIFSTAICFYQPTSDIQPSQYNRDWNHGHQSQSMPPVSTSECRQSEWLQIYRLRDRHLVTR